MITLSLLPVAVLLYYIYKCDYKPEPFSMIARGLFFGVCSVSVVMIWVSVLRMLGITDYFEGGEPTFVSQFLKAFVLAAIPEEFSKLLMLHLLLRKNKYFDEHIDGIVYAACVGLGFAGYENLMYVCGSEDWIFVGVTRAISAVPCHFMTAIAMGYYYSLYRFNIDGKKSQWAQKMILVPILFHGVYDAILMTASVVGSILIVAMIVGIVLWMNKMRKFSKEKIAELKRMDEFDQKNEDQLA
jgi:RsiW-degrading membrane proteinase PrsW (M82 family)